MLRECIDEDVTIVDISSGIGKIEVVGNGPRNVQLATVNYYNNCGATRRTVGLLGLGDHPIPTRPVRGLPRNRCGSGTLVESVPRLAALCPAAGPLGRPDRPSNLGRANTKERICFRNEVILMGN